ncbi:hypothetical protein Tco_0178174 [Tanacetum coccineum]
MQKKPWHATQDHGLDNLLHKASAALKRRRSPSLTPSPFQFLKTLLTPLPSTPKLLHPSHQWVNGKANREKRKNLNKRRLRINEDVVDENNKNLSSGGSPGSSSGRNISEFMNTDKIVILGLSKDVVHNRSQKTLAPMRNQVCAFIARDERNGLKPVRNYDKQILRGWRNIPKITSPSIAVLMVVAR